MSWLTVLSGQVMTTGDGNVCGSAIIMLCIIIVVLYLLVMWLKKNAFR
jgi:hypothetical protein